MNEVPTPEKNTGASDDDQDALVYYCSWDGRVKRVKPRELDQVEHGGVRTRYCKKCEEMTPQAVITVAEWEDDAAVVEALVRVLNYQGVVVRRSIRDNGFYGVQVNRYDGTHRFAGEPTEPIPPRGTEVMMCGPASAAEMIMALRGACRVAEAPDSLFINYVCGPRGLSFDARPGRNSGGGMVRLNLSGVNGQPAEVSEPPYPPFRLFAEKLRDILSRTERWALARVLTGEEDDLDMQQAAALQRPAGINVDSWYYDDPKQAVRVSRREGPDVIW
jgi:hypothetical protein